MNLYINIYEGKILKMRRQTRYCALKFKRVAQFYTVLPKQITLNCLTIGRVTFNLASWRCLLLSMYACIKAFVTCRSYSLSSHECAPVGQTEKMSLACY